MLISRPQKYKKTSNKTTCKQSSIILRPVRSRGWLSLASKDTTRTDLSTVSCVPLRGTCLRRTPPHYSRSAHQCAGRAVYFAAAKYGKAGRPPGVATLVGGQGAGAPKVSGSLAVCVSRFSRIIVLTCYFALGVYCCSQEGPQNVVEASANSLWQGGWRRTHSVKGGLPK